MPMADVHYPLTKYHALVTGGGSGIGFAIGNRLSALGAGVTLLGRDVGRLNAAVRALGSSADCDCIAADVGDEVSIARAFEAFDQHGHTLRILVNNAGAAQSAKFLATDAMLWNEMLRVNLTGIYHCTRAAVSRIVAAGCGRVVNIVSTAGPIGYPYVSAYCAAKHGAIGLTRALAAEYAKHGVTTNAVCPGYTDTGLVRDAIDNIVAATGRTEGDARAVLAAHNPQQRLVTPDEVAAAVAWLCLPESSAINGQAIAVAGGEVMTG
jgi:NAD(P)-dependent dehydrogenase (short-subunit alcohol dehydrogenase family)